VKPVENPLLEEIRGLDVDNLRPMEALLYIEKWQKELRND
jgi:hypothetical protein